MLSLLASSASGYLPASLSRRRLCSAPPPQPVSVPVRLLGGEEAVVGASVDTTLQQLQQECQQAAGVQPYLQRICIQGDGRGPLAAGAAAGPPLPLPRCSHASPRLTCVACRAGPAAEEPREPGLSGLLRSTATNLSSRQRMARQLTDWSSFFLLPEGVSRELRGQGLVSWANDNVWQQLNDRRPPPGTVRVSE